MVSSYPEAGSSKVRARKCYSLFNSQTLAVCWGHLLLFVIQRAKPLSSGTVTSVLLLLKEYRSDSVFRSLRIKCVLLLSSL